MFRLKSLISWFGKPNREPNSAVHKEKEEKNTLSNLEGKALSRYLPADFQGDAGVTLMAGRGKYPLIMARRMLAAGLSVTLMASEDVDQELWDLFSEQRRQKFHIGLAGKWLKFLEQSHNRYVIMAGQIAPKRLFKGLKFDFKALRLLKKLVTKNAESIFGIIASEIEQLGIHVLDARCFMDADIATEGFLGKSRMQISGLDYGIRVVKELAKLDVGQGLVFRKGTVLITEGFDGTDKMLKRAEEFDTRGKVFIKVAKPKQDFRFDVPIVGIQTLEKMHQSGIECLVLEAGKVIMLDREGFIRRADELKISVFGTEIAEHHPSAL